MELRPVEDCPPSPSNVSISTDDDPADETERLLSYNATPTRVTNARSLKSVVVRAVAAFATLSLVVLAYEYVSDNATPPHQAAQIAATESLMSYSYGSNDTLNATTKPTHNTPRPTARRRKPAAKHAVSCSPKLIRLASVDTKANRFYSELGRLNPPLKAPVFRSKTHTHLCSEKKRTKQRWDYCLPISARMDVPFCSGGDRLDLLAPQSPKTLCFSSVLHLLLVDVYEVLQVSGASPALLYGSLLGAVRNNSVIPFTEDADIGYQLSVDKMELLREALHKRGYHLFKQVLWRVCISPVHPLASRLYDPTREIPRCCNIPYVDLYRMQPRDDPSLWSVEKAHKSRPIPRNKLLPYSSVHVNGRAFNTVADPVDFLVHEYGSSYMTPRPRDLHAKAQSKKTHP